MKITLNTGSVALLLGGQVCVASFSHQTQEVAPRIGSLFNPATDAFSSLSILADKITAANNGDVIDLHDQGFRPNSTSAADLGTIIDSDKKNITIKNGYFCGAPELTWVDTGADNIYYADLGDFFTLSNGVVSETGASSLRCYLLDPAADAEPLFHQFPMWNSEFFLLNDTCEHENFISLDPNTDTVHTISGNNQTDDITGFTIAKTETLDIIKRYLDVIGYDPDKVGILFVAGQNRQASAALQTINPVYQTPGDPNTNLLSVTFTFQETNSVFYNNYFRFSFHGATSAAEGLEPGFFSLAYGENKVYYRPVATGNPTKACLPMASCLFDMQDADADFRLENCDLVGCRLVDQTGLIRTYRTGGTTKAYISKCRLTHAGESVRGWTSADNTEFYRALYSVHRYAGSGQLFDRCSFIGINSASAFLAGTPDHNEEPFTVQRCFFMMPLSAHGQCISIYSDSYQNAKIIGNIFVNNKSAITWQHSGNSAIPIPGNVTPYGCRIENNLFVRTRGFNTGGTVEAQSLNQIQAQATLTGIGATMPFYFRHNTLMADHRVVKDTDSNDLCRTININPYSYSGTGMDWTDSRFESNITGAFGGIQGASNSQAYTKSNCTMYRSWNPGTFNQRWYDQDFRMDIMRYRDIIQTPDDDVDKHYEQCIKPHFDYDTLTVTSGSPLATAAADGGPIGHRFAVTPPLNVIENLNWDFSYTYSPELVLPEFTTAQMLAYDPAGEGNTMTTTSSASPGNGFIAGWGYENIPASYWYGVSDIELLDTTIGTILGPIDFTP